MNKIYVDTDVVIDFLIDRKPFSEAASQLFTYGEKQEIEIYISSLSFSNIYYVIRRFVGHEKSIELLNSLEKIVKVLPVDRQIIVQSLNSDFKDFEDGIQNYCAKQIEEIQIIITRNVKDYKKSDLAIHTPESYLKILSRNQKKKK